MISMPEPTFEDFARRMLFGHFFERDEIPRTPMFDGFLRDISAQDPNGEGSLDVFARFVTYANGLVENDRRLLLFQILFERNRLRSLGNCTDEAFTYGVLGAVLADANRPESWGENEVGAVLAATSEFRFDSRSVDDYRFAIALTQRLMADNQQINGEAESCLIRLYERIESRAASPNDDVPVDERESLKSALRGLVDIPERVAQSDLDFADADYPDFESGDLEFDAYSMVVGDALEILHEGNDLAVDLLHIMEYSSSRSWEHETARRHASSPLLRDLARSLIAAIGRADFSQTSVLTASSTTLIKGAAAVLANTGGASDVALLERGVTASAPLAIRSYAAGTPTRACIAALGQLQLPVAHAALVRLHGMYKSGDLKKRVQVALDGASAKSGLSAGALIERAVGDCGLDADSSITMGNASLAAELRVTSADVRTTWLIDGHPVKRVTAKAKTENVAVVTEVQEKTKSISKALRAQRTRLEELLGDCRTWSVADWREFYSDHRLVGPLAAVLLWQGEVEEDVWITFRGASLPDGSTRVRLWHPLEATDEEREYWEQEVERGALVQPFKQAYRERYTPTPEERAGAEKSARFANQIVQINRLYALLKSRGWQPMRLGAYYGGQTGTARRVFGEGRFRISLELELATDPVFDNCATTGSVYFDCASGKSWKRTPVSEVPSLVFSEAMRDVDMFVRSARAERDQPGEGEPVAEDS